MSIKTKYWLRVLAVGVSATAITAVLVRVLGIQIGSIWDWLLYFQLLLPGMYFFVYQWAKRVGYPKGLTGDKTP